MLSRYLIFVRNNFRESHITGLYVLGYGVTTCLTLSIYWFTAKAFAGGLESQIQSFNSRYFDFIVIGEITFLLPTLFYDGPLQVIKSWLQNNTFESFMIRRQNLSFEVATQVSAILPNQGLFLVLYVALAHFLFGWQIGVLDLFILLILNLFFLPLFFFMGLIMVSIFLLTGRGSNLMGQAMALIAIFSGAYFPLDVLPENLRGALRYLPFQSLMDTSRNILARRWDSIDWFSLFSQGLLWTFVTGLLAYSLFQWALLNIRKRGSYFPKTRSFL